MKVGDASYRAALRKLHTLEAVPVPTLAQEIEMAHLRTRLTAAELQHGTIGALAEDYAAVKAAGDLGGVEIG